MHTLGGEIVQSLARGLFAGAEIQYCGIRFHTAVDSDRRGHIFVDGVPLAQQAQHICLVLLPLFGIDGIFIAGRATGKKCAFGRVCTGIGSIANRIAIDVEVASELHALLQLFGGEYFAPVVFTLVIPGEWL